MKNQPERATDLVRAAAETAKMVLNIDYIQKDIVEIKQSIKDMNTQDKGYVLKEDFEFWRNLLVGSMLVTIFLSVIMKYISQ